MTVRGQTSTPVRLCCDLPGRPAVVVGELSFVSNAGGMLIATDFRYADSWIGDPTGYDLCPEMPRTRSPLRFTGVRSMPGAVVDAGPDRWGRNLLFAAEHREAARGPRPVRRLNDGDFVLLVPDETRQGALRFSEDGATFVAPTRAGVPTLVDLDALVAASARHERHRESDADLDLLTRAGTSMGGARPKATVRTEAGALALVKLPSVDDRWDVLAWEAVALELARRAGADVPVSRHFRLDEDASVLVVDRFDRTDTAERVGYMSAHTLTQKRDDEPISYVELADLLGDVSAEPSADRMELFRRIVLTLLVNNVDDHLKNHGLVRRADGWRLSPLFDVNPWPSGRPVDSTPISVDGSGVDRDVDELLGQARRFGLDDDAATALVVDVASAVEGWVDVAHAFGIEDPAGGPLATAFDTASSRQAADLLRAARRG